MSQKICSTDIRYHVHEDKHGSSDAWCGTATCSVKEALNSVPPATKNDKKKDRSLWKKIRFLQTGSTTTALQTSWKVMLHVSPPTFKSQIRLLQATSCVNTDFWSDKIAKKLGAKTGKIAFRLARFKCGGVTSQPIFVLTTKQKKDVLFSKFFDIVHLAIPGKEIRPKEQRHAKQLVQRRPEQKINQVDSLFWTLAFLNLHLYTPFLQHIHNGCWNLERKWKKSYAKLWLELRQGNARFFFTDNKDVS